MDNYKDNRQGGGRWTKTRMTTTTRAADDDKDDKHGIWTMMRRWVTVKINTQQSNKEEEDG